MLQIEIPASERWNEKTQEFEYTEPQILQLEHSLVSISKWESKFRKPFLHTEMNYEETIEYIKCMTITQHVDPKVYDNINKKILAAINQYVDAPMTATTFSEDELKSSGSHKGERTTSELIYFWMISYNVPMECQKWHLNRLLTLLRVCEIKNRPEKKVALRNIYARNKALNNARKAKWGTKG